MTTESKHAGLFHRAAAAFFSPLASPGRRAAEVDRRHRDLLDFSPVDKEQTAGVAQQGGAGRDPLLVRGAAVVLELRGEASPSRSLLRAPEPECPPRVPQVEDLFVPSAAVRPVLQAVGAAGAEHLTAQQCTDLVQRYVKEQVR